MTVLDARRNVTVMQIQCRQNGASSQSLILVVARRLWVLVRDRRQVWRSVGDGLYSGFFVHRNRKHWPGFGLWTAFFILQRNSAIDQQDVLHLFVELWIATLQ